MSRDVLIIYAVATVLTVAEAVMLLRLRSATITERKTYAYRMAGVMLTSGGVVLAISATAMRSWSTAP